MDIITRFFNAGWNIEIIKEGDSIVAIYATKNDGSILRAVGKDLKEAKKDLRLMNRAELSVSQQV